MRATARYWLSPTTRCCEEGSWLRCKCRISLRNPTAPQRCWWAAPRPTPKAGERRCTLRATAWRWYASGARESGVYEGRLFRSLNRGALGTRLDASQVPRIFKAMAERAGLPGEVVSGISGHSTRVGAAQDMVAGGIAMAAILHAGRWKTTAMVNRYGERLLARRSGAAAARPSSASRVGVRWCTIGVRWRIIRRTRATLRRRPSDKNRAKGRFSTESYREPNWPPGEVWVCGLRERARRATGAAGAETVMESSG